jgi:glycosidase
MLFIFGRGIGIALFVATASADATAQELEKPSPTQHVASPVKQPHIIPGWAQDARWYHVVVPSFCNGDPKNDLKEPHGDLAGLAKRLPYFAELRINTLYLSSLFSGDRISSKDPIDLRHIDASLGTIDQPQPTNKESRDPSTWETTPTDRTFLEFIKAAHAKELRVVVGTSFARSSVTSTQDAEAWKYLFHISKRWMDPNADGNPSDGIDGWVLQDLDALPHQFWKLWRDYVKTTNPSAILVADHAQKASPWLRGDEFDVAINYDLALTLRRFFDPRGHTSLQELAADIRSLSTRRPFDQQLASPVVLSGPALGRMRSALSFSMPDGARSQPTGIPVGDSKIGTTRWRLATVLQHFVPGAPMVYYGDEVGMVSTKGEGALSPMWWADGQGVKLPAAYRADFAALTRFLHIRRERDEALRHGALGKTQADGDRGLLTVTRSNETGDVLLVINFGEAKHEVRLTVGTPGQMVGFVGPRLIDMPPPQPGSEKLVKPLMVGGSRRIVKPDGSTRFWINPMTVRLILVPGENVP